MAQLARQGSKHSYIRAAVNVLQPHQWENWIRQYWQFEPEADETLRTIEHQIRHFKSHGVLIGDCDDAAIVCGALGRAAALATRFVAVRPPDAMEFAHVYTEVSDSDGRYWLRLDPTVPAGGEPAGGRYGAAWEKMIEDL